MIPEPVRRRDLVGYGPTPPRFEWPDDARVVVNLVLALDHVRAPDTFGKVLISLGAGAG